jgi:transcriptional regulator GlxA family with amidase domain
LQKQSIHFEARRSIYKSRLSRVVKLLEETATPISMIAPMAGFCDDFILKEFLSVNLT